MADPMPSAEVSQEPEQGKTERAYAVICLVSLLLVVVLMMIDGIGVWSVLPMLVGGIAFLLRWRAGPPLVLFTFLWMAPTRFRNGSETDTFSACILSVLSALIPWSGYVANRRIDLSAGLEDVVLCAALLTYTAACYRVLGLSHSILPPDQCRGRAVAATGISPPRPSVLVPRPGEPANQRELPILFGVLAAATLAGLGLWAASGYLPRWLGLSPTVVRASVSLWVFIAAVALGHAFFRYQGRRRAPLEENLLYLQDQLWRETRSEQGALNRWLVWARLRGQRRKEQ